MVRKYKNYIYILAVLAFIVMSTGLTYSYFVYNKDVVVADLTAGSIGIDFVGESQTIQGTNITTLTDGEGKVSGGYLDFQVEAVADTEEILYEVEIVQSGLTSSQLDNIKVYLTDQNDTEILGVYTYNELFDSKKNNGKSLYQRIVEGNPNGTAKTTTYNYRLRVWIEKSYTETITNNYRFDVYIYAVNIDKENYHKLTFNSDDNRGVYTFKYVESGEPYGDFPNINGVSKWNLNDNEVTEETTFTGVTDIEIVAEWPLSGSEMVLSAINTNDTGTCQDKIKYVEDGITYFSGSNDCINFNYVWYSGKLWRITAIYPDGTMKMITENNITSISFNESSVNFENSYMQMWLNEEFYPTLYNASNIIDTTKKWNATMPADTNISTKPLETTLVTSNVGLLNSYELYNSYRNLEGYSNSYLYNGYMWWLLNPYDASYVWSAVGGNFRNYLTSAIAVRPCIILKFGITFNGNGTIDDPYKIVGDKNAGILGDLINTRISGEYVKLKNESNEQLFRIIDVEDNKTKIIAMDYADNNEIKKFTKRASDILWGSGKTTEADTWYTYLNNTYLPNLKATYGELFDSNTYYLGASGNNYKLSVCANTTSGNTVICDKTSDKGTFDIGLPYYGEMFATQQSADYSNSTEMWLMNRMFDNGVWRISSYALASSTNGQTQAISYAARPTVHLKSTVKILSGSGTQSDPYVVGL